MITERDFERFQRAGRLLDEARRLHNDAGTALVEVLAESNDPRAHEIATAILARLQRDVLIGSESVAAREHWAGSKPDGTDAPPTRSYPPFSHPPSAPPTDAARPLDSRDTEPDSGWCDSRQIENIDERMARAGIDFPQALFALVQEQHRNGPIVMQATFHACSEAQPIAVERFDCRIAYQWTCPLCAGAIKPDRADLTYSFFTISRLDAK